MGICRLSCSKHPDKEMECCICCEETEFCKDKCDDMDNYECAEDCPDYLTENKRKEPASGRGNGIPGFLKKNGK